MEPLCIWIIDHKLSCFAHFQTKINVIERNRKFFRQSADLIKHTALYHHTGRSDGAVILGAHGPVEITVFCLVKTDKGVSCHTAKGSANAGAFGGYVTHDLS